MHTKIPSGELDNDLDINVKTPAGNMIDFAHKSADGGKLDVDDQGTPGEERKYADKPVENIIFEKDPAEGTYEVRTTFCLPFFGENFKVHAKMSKSHYMDPDTFRLCGFLHARCESVFFLLGTAEKNIAPCVVFFLLPPVLLSFG